MSILDQFKEILKGKTQTPAQILIARAEAALNKSINTQTNAILAAFRVRIAGLVGNGQLDWRPVEFRPLWEGSPGERTYALESMARLYWAGFIRIRQANGIPAYDLSVEGLQNRLKSDIDRVVCEIMRRKVSFSDETGEAITLQIADNYILANLHVLNKLIRATQSSEFPKTKQALIALKAALKDGASLTGYFEIYTRLLKAFPDANGDLVPNEIAPPKISKLTWHSLQEIIRFYSEIDGPEKLGQLHITALKRWLAADSAVTSRQDVIFRDYSTNSLIPVLQTVERLGAFHTDQKAIWFRFTGLSSTLPKSGAPSQKWLNSAKIIMTKTESNKLPQFLENVALTDNWPPRLSGSVERTLRAFIYLTIFLPGEIAGKLLTRFAEKTCYKTIPQVGIANEKLGNACLWALINRDDGAGVSYLSRLLTKVKYPKIRKVISQALDEAAAKAKVTRGQLEEQAVSDHGLDANGHKVMKVASGFARLSISGTSSTEITWSTDGQTFKTSIPAALKDEKSDIQAVRVEAKDIATDLSAQVLRVQRIWLEDRSWPADDWRRNYLDHPLMGALTRRLIWTAESDGEVEAFSCHGGKILSVSGKPKAIDGATIRFWHPVEQKLKDVLAWRERVRKLGIVQPFKQAHREVYLVTPAELNTNTYSNRFAGHILKQHQMVALARTTGWNATLRISADVANDAPTHIVLPAHGLVAEYWVEAAGVDEDEFNDAGAYNYLSTDRVCFYRYDTSARPAKSTAYGPERGEPVLIKDVPPLILSEVMRHCDLFVGVASVANDPNWRDGGARAERPNQWRATIGNDYWTHQSFGDLDQASQMRSEFLAEILPALSIAPVCKLEGRFLHVRGKLRKYKIHVGSGNILMEPNDAYLCIVPSAKDKPGAATLNLPFEGDSKLSLVISKAILLAADDKITDQTIIQQIRR